MKRLAFVLLMSSALVAPTTNTGEESTVASDLEITVPSTIPTELLSHSKLEDES
jgi:hypothetical protein